MNDDLYVFMIWKVQQNMISRWTQPATEKKENVRKWKLLATIFALAFGKRHKLSGSLTSHVWYDDSYFFMFDIAYLSYCTIDWRWLFKRLSI